MNYYEYNERRQMRSTALDTVDIPEIMVTDGHGLPFDGEATATLEVCVTDLALEAPRK